MDAILITEKSLYIKMFITMLSKRTPQKKKTQRKRKDSNAQNKRMLK